MIRPKPINPRKANQTFLLILILAFAIICGIANAQIHIKDNQSFHLALGNDGIEIETSRNMYIRAGLGIDKIIGSIGINISDTETDQWVNHFSVRIGKMYKLPIGIFGLEYGVDKKITEKLFIGGRIYNDWVAYSKGTEAKKGFGIRLGFYL